MFYVYENWQAQGHRAKIHRGYCGECQNGKGKRNCKNDINGRWLGPHNTLDEAKQFAHATGGVVSFCQKCLKDEWSKDS